MILTVDDISFGYGSRKILDGVSFTLESGCITSLIGRNGAGKTTLIKLMMGFLMPDAGKVLINGINSHDMKAEGRAKAIAYIPQYTSMVYKYSVLDSVLMGRAPHIMLFSHPIGLLVSLISQILFSPNEYLILIHSDKLHRDDGSACLQCYSNEPFVLHDNSIFVRDG